MAPGSDCQMAWRLLTLSIFMVFLQTSLVRAQLDCNFDSDTCGWQQIVLDDQFDWERNDGDTPTLDTGPYSDHTSGLGDYLYAEASNRVKGQQARMVSEDVRVNVNSFKCFRFWYFIYGSSIGAFRIYTSPTGAFNDLGTPIFEIKSTQGNQWKMGQVDLSSVDGTAFKIVLESEIGSGEAGDIAVDDVSVFSGACPQVIVTPSPGTTPSVLQCDFETQDWCNFVQDTQNNLDWIRQSGRTGTPDTGPPVDHTYGTNAGFYVFVDPSLGNSDDIARLWSPLLPANTGNCAEWYYHMYGDDIGILNVYIVPDGGNVGDYPPVWSMENDQGNLWYLGRAHVMHTAPYYVVFEVIIDRNEGDVAIDDVRITDGACLLQEYSPEYR